MLPRPNAFERLRWAIVRFIHHNNELTLFCYASTFTELYWYSGSIITGK